MSSAPLSEAAPHLRRSLGYRKFGSAHLKVVVLDSGYHLQEECADSLRALGHTVKSIRFEGNMDFGQLLQSLLRTLTGFKPDFLLSINHLGFDREGALGALLEQMHLPIAAWYVDSPFFVLRSSGLFAQSVTSTFLWDEAYAPAMKQAGAQDVHYLPLAADTRILNHPTRSSAPRFPILFVGDSMQQAELKWRGRIAPQAQAQCQSIVAQLLEDRGFLLHRLRDPQRRTAVDWDLLALATFRATGSYRASILRDLPSQSLHLMGDSGWRDLLPQAHHYPPVHYGTALAEAFQDAVLNVNATSLQMPTAVNQRVFDVPAAGGFLLTDSQSDIQRHFVLPQEFEHFHSPQQARDLAAFYARKPSVRSRVIAQMRTQVLQRHTYVHRLRTLVACMRQRHSIHTSRVQEAI